METTPDEFKEASPVEPHEPKVYQQFIKVQVEIDHEKGEKLYMEALENNQQLRDCRISYNQWVAEHESEALSDFIKYL